MQFKVRVNQGVSSKKRTRKPKVRVHSEEYELDNSSGSNYGCLVMAILGLIIGGLVILVL